MTWINFLLLTLASFIMILFQILTYKILTNEKFKLNIWNIFFIIIGSLIIAYNNFNVNSLLRAFISYSTILSVELLIFRDKVYRTISIGTISYILIVISEIILGSVLLATKIVSLEDIDKNILIKCIYSVALVIPAYFIAKIKFFNKIVNKIDELFKKSYIWRALLTLCLCAVIILAFKNVMSFTAYNFVGSIILLIGFLLLIIIIYIKESKAEKEVENTKVLLDFMVQYEKKIDEDRINRHEMLNNLLILKSYDDKNSKKYNDTLDDLIKVYSKKRVGINNIYKLPSGLKGIIYYKINDIKDKNLNININISKQLSEALENMNHKTYAAICKIVGITFDNAIEASIKSKDKLINLDIYEDNENITIEIDNSYSNKIDMDKINNKYYSTKGKHRGLGLYIVKTLIINNKNISLEQLIEGKIFITKIQIKKSR